MIKKNKQTGQIMMVAEGKLLRLSLRDKIKIRNYGQMAKLRN